MTDRIAGEKYRKDVTRHNHGFNVLGASSNSKALAWYFPPPEHTRFQHSLGTLHVAGVFSEQLLSLPPDHFQNRPPPFSIWRNSSPGRAPSMNIGHGPFCHFFDEQYRARFNTNHEEIGQTHYPRKKISSLLKPFGEVPRLFKIQRSLTRHRLPS